MGILGGSPLGLIGVQSRPTRDGMSTFNGGRSRNINVNLYNSGKETDKAKLSKVFPDPKNQQGMFSQFTGGNVLQAWPNISKIGVEDKTMGVESDYPGVSRRTLHNNDVYDTSILNIIEKLSGTRSALRPSDFAYCKNLGVYPNNRLIIARRFAGAVNDNILDSGMGPLAVLITWRSPADDFVDITFGEAWTDAEADFTNVLNDIGKDLMGKVAGDKLGSVAGAAFGALPLPGFSETLTRFVLENMGIYRKGSTDEPLPAGNPNLIKEAKIRKTVPYGDAGSGLKCTFSVKMTCEYEQKFISGIDPTIAYIDILANALRFGTSPHVDYGLDKGFATKVKGWVNNPSLLVSDIANALSTALTAAVQGVVDSINKEFGEKIKAAEDEETATGDNGGEEKEELESEKLEKEKKLQLDAAAKFLDPMAKLGITALSKTVQKYRQRIYGIASALSLTPSTPWHVTIGNPLRPIFCSGDLYTDSVQLTLGPNLAFNDLPSSIKLDFTLTPARSWSLTDIMAKFNTGNIRTVNVVRDFPSTSPNQLISQDGYTHNPPTPGQTPDNGNNGAAGAGGGTNTQSNPGDTTGSDTTTKENQEQKKINNDPNASTGAVTK